MTAGVCDVGNLRRGHRDRGHQYPDAGGGAEQRPESTLPQRTADAHRSQMSSAARQRHLADAGQHSLAVGGQRRVLRIVLEVEAKVARSHALELLDEGIE